MKPEKKLTKVEMITEMMSDPTLTQQKRNRLFNLTRAMVEKAYKEFKERVAKE